MGHLLERAESVGCVGGNWGEVELVAAPDRRAALAVLARKVAAGERRPGQHAQSLLATERQQLVLEVPSDQ